jgi:hypothetical protein
MSHFMVVDVIGTVHAEQPVPLKSEAGLSAAFLRRSTKRVFEVFPPPRFSCFIRSERIIRRKLRLVAGMASPMFSG